MTGHGESVGGRPTGPLHSVEEATQPRSAHASRTVNRPSTAAALARSAQVAGGMRRDGRGRRPLRLLATGIAAATALAWVTGCTQSGSATIAPQAAVVTLPLSGAVPTLTPAAACAALTASAQRLPADHRWLVNHLGTQRDPGQVIRSITEALRTMTTLAPSCEPLAVAEIAALNAASIDALGRYDTGVVTAMGGDALVALARMADRGREAWSALGMSPAEWR